VAGRNRPLTPPSSTAPSAPNTKKTYYAGFPFIAGLDQNENGLAYGLALVALILVGTKLVKDSGEKKSLHKSRRTLRVKV